MKKILLIFTILFFTFSNEVHADNLLLNSSFEDVSSGVPNSWTKNVSTATLSISSTFKTGSESASINKTNSTTGTIYLYQDVDVEPNSYYSLVGWTIKNDPKFSYSLLRISWRDASAEISKTDSSQLTSDSQTFQELKIDSVQAPNLSIKARIELLANISSPNPANPILFDDVSFSQVSAPEQPVSTPVATVTTDSTSTPTPTPAKTPTPTKTPIPTKTPSPSPISSPEILVLGEGTIFPTPQTSESGQNLTEKPKGKIPLLAIGLVILGMGFIGFSVFTIIKNAKKSYTIESGKENNQIF